MFIQLHTHKNKYNRKILIAMILIEYTQKNNDEIEFINYPNTN